MKSRTFYYFLADILAVSVAFLFFIWLKPASQRVYLPNYYQPFLIFLFIWISVSVAIDKYRIYKKKTFNNVLSPIIIGDLIVLATVAVLIYAFQLFQYSRLIVFGTIMVSFVLEIILGYLFFTSQKLRRDADYLDLFTGVTLKALKKQQKLIDADEVMLAKIRAPVPPLNKDLIVRDSGEGVLYFIENQIDVDFYNAIVNLRKVNSIQRINKFHEAVNSKLPHGGIFIGCVQTNLLVKQKILKKFPPLINYMVYILFFIWKRVIPKLPVTKRIYFFFTKGRNRALSKAEIFGRLFSCGFELVAEEMINDNQYFAARKIQEPSFDYSPTYGPLIRLKRIGKNGKIIYVYKMRTMHPYSEYLQQYVYEHSRLKEGGKFKDDFRVNTAGKYLRRLWIDELPMLINFLRGDLKIVGVRPLSKHYFELYDEELKVKRIKTRPGLIPPFY
jgi:hypothetical protein